jgi:hypothetical protein
MIIIAKLNDCNTLASPIYLNQIQPTKSYHYPEPKITFCEAELFYEGEGSDYGSNEQDIAVLAPVGNS